MIIKWVILVVGVTWALFAPAVAFAVENESTKLVLGYDERCLKDKGDLIADVSAVAVVCEQNCPSFQKTISLKSVKKYQLKVEDLTKKTGNPADNLMVAVTVCKDLNKNKICDEKSTWQAFRLHGKYFKDIYPEGNLTFDFRSLKDREPACDPS